MAIAAPLTQLNVRLPKDLKADGDRTLSLVGSSPTRIIRELWTKLAQGAESYESLYAAIADDSGVTESDDVTRKLRALEQACSLVPDFGRRMGLDLADYRPLDDEALKEAAYLDLLDGACL